MQYAGSGTEVVQFRQEFVEVDGAGHSVYFEKAWFTHTTASTINLVRPTLCNLCILDQSCRAWGDQILGQGLCLVRWSGTSFQQAIAGFPQEAHSRIGKLRDLGTSSSQ